MSRSYSDFVDFIEEEDVQFIKLVFFDVFGNQKNISVLPSEITRACKYGISFDASMINGFGQGPKSDLFLKPDLDTISLVPWRPLDGKVVSVFCDIVYPDGQPFEKDTRYMLKQAVKEAKKKGVFVEVGTEVEFYIFKLDENGERTNQPIDHAGYMATAPEDRGENLRRDICFALFDMDITPETSHHESGPGQSEVDFHYSDALTAADNTSTFKWAVANIADSSGYWADFSPKPLRDYPGNGMHLNISLETEEQTMQFMAGVLHYIKDITLFLNPVRESYDRFGEFEAPRYVSWSRENRSQLIRIPADPSGRTRFELRSPDPKANPYLALSLLIRAGLEGMEQKLALPDPVDTDLFNVNPEETEGLEKLPQNIEDALHCAKNSEFVNKYVPKRCLAAYKKAIKER